jgi:hypothetical protein
LIRVSFELAARDVVGFSQFEHFTSGPDEHNREQAVWGIADKKAYRNWSEEENNL